MWVIGLCLAYVAACVAQVDFSRVPPEASSGLLDAVLSKDVMLGLTGNVAVHLLLLLLLALIAMPLRHWMIARLRTQPWLAGVTAASMAWGAAFSFNQLQFGYSAHSEMFAKSAVWPIFVGTSILLAVGWVHLAARHRKMAGVMCLLALASMGLAQMGPRPANAAKPPAVAPNVFVFGIDSMSMPVFQENGQQLPHLWRIWQSSHRYENAHTPLARTCPAWMSVLSGKSPAEHGAVCNLRQWDRTERKDLLSQDLHRQGYRTIFALDERRFCHIDGRYGFDAVVGPDLGVLDFIVQSMNDSPLTNLILQWEPLAEWLGYSHHNVASVANYDANGFSLAVLDAVGKGRGPVFAAMHFESAHFPYRSRHASVGKNDQLEGYDRHLAALKVVDAQVGMVLEGLRRKGMLENALLVLLSDHGESFGRPMHIRYLNGKQTQLRPYGHGAFLIQPNESHVVLGLTHFVGGEPEERGSTSTDLVSLADVRAGVNDFLRDGRIRPLKPRDCLMLETGIRFEATSDLSQFDPAELMKEASQFYAIDPSGLMHLREDRLADVIAKKDVARLCGETFTLHESATGRAATYRRTAESATEIALQTEDVQAIQAHRQRLMRLAQ